MTKGIQGFVPPRGERQANLAWLSLARVWFHRTRPDQTLCSRRQRRQGTLREALRTVLKSGPSAVRTPRICELLHISGPGAWCVAGFLMEKFHPGDGAMTESILSTTQKLDWLCKAAEY